MGSLLRAFLFAMRGKKSSELRDEEIEAEIKKAERAGEMAARSAEKRLGIVEQVEVDAEVARQEVQRKVKNNIKEDEERAN